MITKQADVLILADVADGPLALRHLRLNGLAFGNVSLAAGGDAKMRSAIFAGSFVLLNDADLARAIATAPWMNPLLVQVLIKRDTEPTWGIFKMVAPEDAKEEPACPIQ